MPDTNTNPNSPIVTSPTSSTPTGGGFGQVGSQTPPLSSSIPSTISSSSIAPAAPITIPPPPPVNTGAVANAGTVVTTPQSITDQSLQQTPLDQQRNDILNSIAQLTGNDQSQNTLTLNQEKAAGLPALYDARQTISDRIQGLTDQSTALQNAAAPGGTIQNTEQNNAQGRGITAGGLAPLISADLRNNQIQQASINTQILSQKALYLSADRNYSEAKTAADNAAQLAFDAQEQQIKYKQAQLAAIQPQLTKEEAAQAALQQVQLQDRQTQITQGINDAKTGQAMVATALANNPNDHVAGYAISEASKIPLTDPNYLQKVTALVGKYQSNPLDTQLKQAQISEANASAAKTRMDTSAMNPSGASTTTIQDNNGNDITVPVNVAPYVSFSNSGVKYADLSTVQGTATEKAAIVNQAQAAGIKVITNKNTALDLTNIGDANSKLDTISTIMSGVDQPDALSRDLYGLGMTKLATMAQSNPQQAAAGALQGVGLDILKAISGVQGFRGNTSVVQQITDHLPSIYDSQQTVQDKISYIRSFIDDRENSILGQQGTNSKGGTISAGGKSFIVGQVYQDANGAKWVADTNGNWTKQ